MASRKPPPQSADAQRWADDGSWIDAMDESAQVEAQHQAVIRKLEKLAARAAAHHSLAEDLRRRLVF